MNDLLQPGQHLDPDQLNAFAEGVLPEHERLQTLAHLADCPHCRQIVFLAQQAQQSEEPAQVKAASTWPDWFRFSPLSMLGAASAALACALIVTVALHLNHNAPTPPTTETAKAEPAQSLLPVTPSEQALAAVPPAPKQAAAKAVPLPAQSPALSKPPVVDAIQGGAISPDTSETVRVHPQLQLVEPSPATAAPAPAPPYFPSAGAANSSAVQELPANGRAFLSKRAEATSSIPQTLPAKAGLRPLPSKLPIATTISSSTSTLAADSAGTLFISQHGGEPWQAVEQQWQGKVARLALTPQATNQLALQKQRTETKDSTEKLVVAPSSFQLTTEAGVVWVSEDGMHWRQR
jgi:Putative zinc-finger